MDQTEQNNPAGRLHAILSSVLEEIKGKQNHNGLALWSTVFDVKLSNPISLSEVREVITRILQFDKLIDETEASLLGIEGLPDRYYRPFARIRAIPKQTLTALTSDIAGQIKTISEGDMTVLEFCSERLEQQHRERIIDKAELNQILQDVTTLFNEVQQADIDAELQTFILDGLESIRRGIYEFRIRGPVRLKETIGEIVGSLYVNYKTVAAAGEDESLEKFNTLFNRLTTLVTFANTSVKLLSAVATPLLPG